MTVRFGSARITDSSTISSTTTITRCAANAASFWTPMIPRPREYQLSHAARGDHLIGDEVWCQPAERQIAPPLTNDFVAGRKGDQVGEALERNRVAIPHQGGDGVAHVADFALSHSIAR